MNTELKKRIISSILLIPLSFFLIIEGFLLFNIFILICFFVTCYEWYMMTKKKYYHLIGYFFLFFSFYSTYKLRNNPSDDSLIVFLTIVIICIFTDIGGYIFGKIFKGPRLTKISPSKTYAGMIGSYILSIISIFLIIKFLDVFNIISINFNIKIFLFIFVVSTVSQIGDLIISFFKRLSKIKDTGKIIPGHGGLLDRIDGMIFAFPFVYLFYSISALK